MIIQITDSKTPLSNSEIVEFEDEMGIVLPTQYRQFLLKFNGGHPTPCEFGFRRGAYGRSMVSEFWAIHEGPSSLKWQFDAFKTREKRIADDLMSIACDPSGNQICLGINGNRNGQVFFWDHEEENDEDEPEHNVYLIAPSFDEFLNGLTTYERREPKPRSAWMDTCPRPPEPVVQPTLWND